jgi:hypothetical protein
LHNQIKKSINVTNSFILILIWQNISRINRKIVLTRFIIGYENILFLLNKLNAQYIGSISAKETVSQKQKREHQTISTSGLNHIEIYKDT